MKIKKHKPKCQKNETKIKFQTTHKLTQIQTIDESKYQTNRFKSQRKKCIQ